VSKEIHEQARTLIARQRIEGLPDREREWLAAHLAECAACAELERATGEAIRTLRAVSIPLPPGLASRTQMRVRLRAQQLREYEPRWRMVWLMCGISWIFGAATAPFVWRALEWFGHRVGLPDMVWELGFGLWWALPAAVAGVILLITNAGRSGETDWKRQHN
jgi:anti-sigma factor RsiW